MSGKISFDFATFNDNLPHSSLIDLFEDVLVNAKVNYGILEGEEEKGSKIQAKRSSSPLKKLYNLSEIFADYKHIVPNCID